MTSKLRILLILGSIFTLLFFLSRISRNKLKISHSIFWILFSFALLLLAIFPGIADAISRMLGIYSTPNTVYLLAICMLIFKQFINTLHISQLTEQVSALTQELAIYKLETEQKASAGEEKL